MPAVAADVDAASLLNSIDAACAVLLRTVSNVLHLRALQRDGALTLAPPQPCALGACIQRAVAMVCAFGGEPPRISWTAEVNVPLPDRVLVDPAALDACLQNVLLAAVRLGAWQPTRSAVRLHVATEPAGAELAGVVALHITAQGCDPEDCPPDTFHLVITAETPGRALTRSECDTLLTQFGMAPPDKGGGTGLSLFVARGLARSMGGDLFIDTNRDDATFITTRLVLRVPGAGMLKHVSPPSSSTGSGSDSGSSSEGTPAAAPVDEVELTSRMFECLLTNSDDVFAICRLSTDADAPLGLACVVDYISPSVERGLAFCQQAVVGASLLSVCLPEDRPAFAKAISAAHRGEGPRGHNLECMHRSVTGDGGSIWCHTFGLCVDDVLYLVCRDIRARKSVEIAMRAFTLATTHDLRECCNAVLVSTAMPEKRDCIAGSSISPPPSPDCSPASAAAVTEAAAAAAAAAADDVPLEPCFLVSCIRTACGLFTGIIGNVLTAPQVEEGHLELEAEVFSPKATLRDVMQACRMGCAAAAQPGGSAIEWEEADDETRKLPPLVECDSKRLSQVLQNVLCVPRFWLITAI